VLGAWNRPSANGSEPEPRTVSSATPTPEANTCPSATGNTSPNSQRCLPSARSVTATTVRCCGGRPVGV
jgi:hypothetical protein